MERVPPGFVDLTVGLLEWMDRVKVSRKPPEALAIQKMLEEGAGEPAPEGWTQELNKMGEPRDKLEIEELTEAVRELRLKHKTFRQIAAELDIPCSTAFFYYSKLLKQYRETTAKDFTEAKNEELDRIETLCSECMAQYEGTKDIRWLEEIRKFLEMRYKIIGVNAPDKHELTTKTAMDELLGMSDAERAKAREKLEDGNEGGGTPRDREDRPSEG